MTSQCANEDGQNIRLEEANMKQSIPGNIDCYGQLYSMDLHRGQYTHNTMM